MTIHKKRVGIIVNPQTAAIHLRGEQLEDDTWLSACGHYRGEYSPRKSAYKVNCEMCQDKLDNEFTQFGTQKFVDEVVGNDNQDFKTVLENNRILDLEDLNDRLFYYRKKIRQSIENMEQDGMMPPQYFLRMQGRIEQIEILLALIHGWDYAEHNYEIIAELENDFSEHPHYEIGDVIDSLFTFGGDDQHEAITSRIEEHVEAINELIRSDEAFIWKCSICGNQDVIEANEVRENL